MHILRFAALYGFWIVLSGRFEPKYLIIGAFCAAAITYLTRDLMRPDGVPAVNRGVGVNFMIAGIGSLVLYVFWLLWSIVQSNLEVAYIVRQPKLFLFDEPPSNLDATLRASMRVEWFNCGARQNLAPQS